MRVLSRAAPVSLSMRLDTPLALPRSRHRRCRFRLPALLSADDARVSLCAKLSCLEDHTEAAAADDEQERSLAVLLI
jgi:hypothetical protein